MSTTEYKGAPHLTRSDMIGITADFDLRVDDRLVHMTLALLCFGFCFDHSEISSQCFMDDLHSRQDLG